MFFVRFNLAKHWLRYTFKQTQRKREINQVRTTLVNFESMPMRKHRSKYCTTELKCLTKSSKNQILSLEVSTVYTFCSIQLYLPTEKERYTKTRTKPIVKRFTSLMCAPMASSSKLKFKVSQGLSYVLHTGDYIVLTLEM